MADKERIGKLVLGRRCNDIVCIGDDVEVQVVDIHGSKSVRLQIRATVGSLHTEERVVALRLHEVEGIDDVDVEVVGICGSTVRLAIFAPISVRVDRKEVRERLLAEQEAASPK